jgi:hypothetical protein
VTGRRLAEVRARRERLVAKAAAQRDEMALLLEPWHRPLAVADRGVTLAVYLRERPAIVLVAVAALVVLAPKRAFRWARRAYALWRGYRWAAKALHQVIPPVGDTPQSVQS